MHFDAQAVLGGPGRQNEPHGHGSARRLGIRPSEENSLVGARPKWVPEVASSGEVATTHKAPGAGPLAVPA